MSGFITGATAWLATYLIHSTLLLLGALAVTRWLRDPAARERVWKVALVAPLLTVSLAGLLPRGARPVFDLAPRLQAGMAADTAVAPPPPEMQRSSQVTQVTVIKPGAPAMGPVPTAPPRDVPRASDVAPPGHWLGLAAVTLWAVGAVGLLARRALALRHLRARLASRRVLRKGLAHDLLAELCRDDELSAQPRLTLADDLSTPLVLGPAEICLPRRVAEELPPRELAAILAHEVAHVRRGDLLWLRGCALLECVLFAQPLNRLARRRFAQDAELLCDDWAGERTGARLELAQGLETVARWSRVAPRPLPLPCLGGDRGVLLQRVERLLAEPEARRRTVGLSAILAGGVLLLAWVGPGVQLASHGAPDIDELDTDTLVALRKQSCALAAERLLALPEDWEQRYANALAVPGARAVRILRRGLYDLAPKRGGGAYYSFATDDHDYNREPDLEYQDGSLSTGFAGDATGLVLDLGTVPLADVSLEGELPGLDAETARLRRVMSTFVPGEGRADTQFAAALGIDGPRSATAVVGHTCLLRAILPGQHDHLVAFVLEDVQPESVVLVGRVLQSWPVTDPGTTASRVEWSSAAAPAWLTQLEDASLFALQAQLANTIESRVLAVSTSAIKAATGLGPPGEAGLTRLLLPGQYDAVINLRGAGSYYSFATRSHSYDEEPDIAWEPGWFRTAFYGGCIGAFLDVGDVPLADLELGSGTLKLTDKQTAVWAGLVAGELPAGAREFGRAPVLFNHTYVLRSTLPGEHDLLVAIRPVLEDTDGITIAWRMLKHFPTPER